MKRYQVNNIDYKNILITSGAQQGLAYLAKGMIEPGSVVIVEIRPTRVRWTPSAPTVRRSWVSAWMTTV